MVIGITNLKGGVGKTTIAQNIAVCLSHMEYSVCIVDTDTNQNSMQWYAERQSELPDIMVYAVTDKGLSKSVTKFNEDYDFVIIDGTPSLEDIATRIILASDLLLIPVTPNAHDYRTLDIFFERYEQAKSFREEIPAYLLLNQFDERMKLDQGIRDLFSSYEVELMKTTIKRRNSYRTSAITGKGAYENSDPKAKKEMVSLTKEILENIKKHNLAGTD